MLIVFRVLVYYVNFVKINKIYKCFNKVYSKKDIFRSGDYGGLFL